MKRSKFLVLFLTCAAVLFTAVSSNAGERKGLFSGSIGEQQNVQKPQEVWKEEEVTTSSNHKFSRSGIDKPKDFDAFLNSCSALERIQMLQALRQLPSFNKAEHIFNSVMDGKISDLNNLGEIYTNYNDVKPEDVLRAVREGKIDRADISVAAVKKALLWRSYNKTKYYFRDDYDEVDYQDILTWVAGQVGVQKNEVSQKFFSEIWEELSPKQRERIVYDMNLKKSWGLNFENLQDLTETGQKVYELLKDSNSLIALSQNILTSAVGYAFPESDTVCMFIMTVNMIKNKTETASASMPMTAKNTFSASSNEVSAVKFLDDVVEALRKNDSAKVRALLTVENVRNLIANDRNNINAKIQGGYTLLMVAASEADDPEITRMLLNVGANVNAKDNVGATVLMKSLKRHNPAIVRMLLNAGANVNDRDPETGLTPLMIAANVGTPEVVEMLLYAGANVNEKAGKYDFTPLIIAAMNNTDPEVTRVLLRAGADVNAEAKAMFGLVRVTAKEIAKRTNKNPEVLRVLESYGGR